MTKGFRRTKNGIGAAFDVMQAGVLRRLAGDIEELMDQRSAAEPDTAPTPQPGTDPFEALFADFASGASRPPEDPVLARLLPDGYSPSEVPSDAHEHEPEGKAASADLDADAASADFRRFTEPDLRSGKTANARLIRDSLASGGGTVLLDDDQAASWLGGLNDMRLALGTALEVGPDTDREYARIDPMTSRARRLHLYFWLGALQESLVDALTDG